MTQTVGFIGVRQMGYGVSRSLLRNGFRVHVVAHRRRDRTEDLVERGATEATFAAAKTAGVDLQLLYEILSSADADNPIFQGAAPKIVAADHPVSATISVCAKDAGPFADMEEGQLDKAFTGPAARDLFEIAASMSYRDADGPQAYTALLRESANKWKEAAL